jgi:hypothetical protein
MQTPARPTPKANVAAMVNEILDEARQNAAEPAQKPARRIPAWVSLVLLVALCAWVWVAPPEWLVPRPAAPPSVEYRRASARVALALHAQRIDAYRATRGRLPRNATEAGIRTGDFEYTRLDTLTYELSSRVSGEVIAYRSTQPRDQFLAAAMTALGRARR